MFISAIHTYPVKGCYRLDHEAAFVHRWGLDGDRRWLIVEADGPDAVTQREVPGLTQIRPATVDGGLVLTIRGRPDLHVKEPDGGEHTRIRIFDYKGVAAPAGAEADEWLSAALGVPVRLVWLDDPMRRPVAGGEAGDTVNFADGFPVLLANVASLNALNDLIIESRAGSPLSEDPALDGPLPMTRFRPNLVISQAPPWIEDEWTGGRIRIGEMTFRVPQECGRCVVTTTDQETGRRGREPLLTLARHRNVGQKLLFATNLIPDAPGTVSVGDPVTPV